MFFDAVRLLANRRLFDCGSRYSNAIATDVKYVEELVMSLDRDQLQFVLIKLFENYVFKFSCADDSNFGVVLPEERQVIGVLKFWNADIQTLLKPDSYNE